MRPYKPCATIENYYKLKPIELEIDNSEIQLNSTNFYFYREKPSSNTAPASIACDSFLSAGGHLPVNQKL